LAGSVRLSWEGVVTSIISGGPTFVDMNCLGPSIEKITEGIAKCMKSSGLRRRHKGMEVQ
jgi:hypothetical protein